MAPTIVFPTDKRIVITVKGAVQGIGFRPFVFRLAKRCGLKGRVHNSVGGVVIELEGAATGDFIRLLESEPPPLARIDTIEIETKPVRPYSDFQIAASSGTTDATSEIMPDLATCPDCRNEIEQPKTRRYRYPFTNCTQCGPRFSIITKPPYDRIRTTMRTFTMCKDCYREYHDPADRRFHAQPNCCPKCGPGLFLLMATGERLQVDDPIGEAVRLLRKGKILAIKGIGGFHIGCDAANSQSIRELRRRKKRPDKPFALMVATVDQARRICHIETGEETLLGSAAAPVVLLRKKSGRVAPEVAPANGYLGIMLAYAPLHHLLFSRTPRLGPLVMTSGNIQDEPIITTDEEIGSKLGNVVDFIVTHDRPIENRSDDSVVFFDCAPVLVRRARGYAPGTLSAPFSLKPSLACGALQKNTFALGKGKKVYLSPHIGDLDTEAGLKFFNEMALKYQGWFNVEPEIVACDLHPDYLSTRYAEALNKPLVRIQHHHSHIAACMADNGLNEPVIGVAYDGTGYGLDGKVWGGEFFVGDYRHFYRKGHLAYLPLAGGDAAIKEPLRITAGYLFHLFGKDIVEHIPEIGVYQGILGKIGPGVNTIQTSSMGRLFDAVSALVGLVPRSSFDGQAPIALEALVAEVFAEGALADIDPYPVSITDCVIDPGPIFEGILRDRREGKPTATISGRFHQTVSRATGEICTRIKNDTHIRTVCLGGGVFQNRILSNLIRRELTNLGFEVYMPIRIPINDGGISFGQLMIATIANR